MLTADQHMELLNWLEYLADQELTLGDVIEGIKRGSLTINDGGSVDPSSISE